MFEISCSQCGGQLILNPGDNVVVGSFTITLDEDKIRNVQSHNAAWCAQCLQEWDKRLGFSQ